MPITAFTQQQCVCEGKYAACAGPQEKNAKKKRGGPAHTPEAHWGKHFIYPLFAHI